MNQESCSTDPRVPRDSATVDPGRAWSQLPGTCGTPNLGTTDRVWLQVPPDEPGQPTIINSPRYSPPDSNPLFDGNLTAVGTPKHTVAELCARQVVTPEQETKDILEEEANVLARWLESHRTAPHPARVEIAVLREIARLRKLAARVGNPCVYSSGAESPLLDLTGARL